jgi:hypothetical protein
VRYDRGPERADPPAIARVTRSLVVVAVLAALVFVDDASSAPAGRSAAPGTRVCGQIKNGPYASYLSSVSGIKSKGTTWTVLATDVPCSFALAQTPALLKQWAKAPLGGSLRLTGATCLKMTDGGYSGTGTSSGGFVCHRGAGAPTSVFGARTFAARETNPYTIPQIKAFFGIK